jgi:hypothetical protein
MAERAVFKTSTIHGVFQTEHGSYLTSLSKVIRISTLQIYSFVSTRILFPRKEYVQDLAL